MIYSVSADISNDKSDVSMMDPVLASKIQDILRTCDTNGDGVISYSGIAIDGVRRH